MFLHRLTIIVSLLSVTAGARGQGAAPKAGSDTKSGVVEASPTGGAPSAVPRSPLEMYLHLSEATRPQWRQLYRPTVTRCLDGRPQAAMGLGAVAADLYLAAAARDSQQVRNLLQDEETIEKTLGLVEHMAPLRGGVLMAAEQSDWTLLGESIDRLTIGLRHHLRGQKDEPLAELAFIGQWLRTLQTCHAVVIAKALSNQELAIGSPLLISEMTRRLNLMSDPATESVTCLKLLHRRLAGLSRLWPEDGGMVINPEDRLRKSAELLGDTVGKLLEEETAAGAANAVNP